LVVVTLEGRAAREEEQEDWEAMEGSGCTLLTK
jgi:hypothetical protein